MSSRCSTVWMQARRARPPRCTASARRSRRWRENGFLVRHLASERAALESYFAAFREDTSQLRITILTTLRCNFACDYCYQGEHADFGPAGRQHVDRHRGAGRGVDREAGRRGAAAPPRAHLLRGRAAAERARRCSKSPAGPARHAASRGVTQFVNIITNGLLLTPRIVERLLPLGLTGVKVTLDGDRETHDRMRPLRGGQGTFDRIIENVRRVAPTRCRSPSAATSTWTPPIGIRRCSTSSRSRTFAGRISKVAFKPIIKPGEPAHPGRDAMPLRPVEFNRRPLNGSCMTAAGPSTGARAPRARLACDTCNLARRHDDVAARGDAAARVPDARTACTWARARCTGATPTPSAPTARCTPAPGSPASYALAVGHIDGRRERRARRGRAPLRAPGAVAPVRRLSRSFRCAAAAARWQPMPSLATWMRRRVTSAVSNRRSCSLAEEAARGQAGRVQMKVKVLKNAQKSPSRDMCPWMICVPPESKQVEDEGASPRRRAVSRPRGLTLCLGLSRGTVCRRVPGSVGRVRADGRVRRSGHGDHRRARRAARSIPATARRPSPSSSPSNASPPTTPKAAPGRVCWRAGRSPPTA